MDVSNLRGHIGDRPPRSSRASPSGGVDTAESLNTPATSFYATAFPGDDLFVGAKSRLLGKPRAGREHELPLTQLGNDLQVSKQGPRCELCGTAFTFTPLYTPNTPALLSPFELASGLGVKAVMALR